MSKELQGHANGKADITDKWRQSAQLTSERGAALDLQTSCLNLQRKLFLFAKVYTSHSVPPQVLSAWDTLQTYTQEEFDRLQEEINRCDAILEKLTPELHDFMMDGSTL